MKLKFRTVMAAVILGVSQLAQADALESLKSFVREAKTGSAQFTQTVTAPDGKRKKVSSGSFEFARPGQFRFAYTKPYSQLIVGDGNKVWLYDADLEQVTVRKASTALGNTPAALLVGGDLEQSFDLKPEVDVGGVQWVMATPKKTEESPFRSMRIGFKGKDLVTVDIADTLGQRSILEFKDFKINPNLKAEIFQFKPPPGVQVLEQ